MTRRQQDSVREQIKSSMIVQRLQSFITGDVQMTTAQVRAALGLLDKTLPALQSVTHSGDAEHPVEVRATDVVFTDVLKRAEEMQPVPSGQAADIVH